VISSKELLVRLAPGRSRRVRNSVRSYVVFAVIQAVAPSVGVEVSPIDLNEQNQQNQIERAIATFAQSPNGGLIHTASGIGAANVDLIIAAAARYKLPAIYNQRPFVVSGGFELS
jgi:putative ABC transport system substrate-binding protein